MTERSLSDTRAALAATPLGKYLTVHELDELFLHNVLHAFQAGDCILAQGQHADGIYLLLEGKVTVSAEMLGNGIIPLEELGAGSFFGEISHIEKNPSVTSVRADSAVQCLHVSEAWLDMLTAFYPETKYRIFLAVSLQVCERLKKMHDSVVRHISAADMKTTSLFRKILGTLTVPVAMSAEEAASWQQLPCHWYPFHEFTREEQEILLQQGNFLKVPKNCTLIHREEKNASCLVVLKGAVQSEIVHEGKSARLSTIGPGILFAAVACVNRQAAFTVTFMTCEQALLFRLPESALDFFREYHPPLWFRLFDLICRSLVELQRSVDKLDVRLGMETYNQKAGK